MKQISRDAHAKINLALDVTGEEKTAIIWSG